MSFYCKINILNSIYVKRNYFQHNVETLMYNLLDLKTLYFDDKKLSDM